MTPGYDRNVFEPAADFEQIETIHNNAVRRGLFAKPEDRHWSGAADHADLRAGALRMDRGSRVVFVIC